MEGDHGQSPAWVEQTHGDGQNFFHRVKLAVHRNPQGLERARGRMDPRSVAPPPYRPHDDPCELCRRAEWPRDPDGLSNLAAVSLLALFVKNVCQLLQPPFVY